MKIRRLLMTPALLGVPLMAAFGLSTVAPQAAHAGPPPPSDTGVQLIDSTATSAVLCGSGFSCLVNEISTSPYVLYDTKTAYASYTVSYQSGSGSYCIQGAHGVVAAFSSSGGVIEDNAGACGTNEEWGITCIGASEPFSFKLYVKAGPLAGDYAQYISSTNGDLYANSTGSDVFYDASNQLC